MTSKADCMAKAAALEKRAEECASERDRDRYLELATEWRRLAAASDAPYPSL
jgi:hypothetical protein